MNGKVLLLFVPALAFAQDWSPHRAAQYLDARQKEWFAWKEAQSADGPCVSCHTGLTYLLVRPVLGAELKETGPTEFEKGLLARLRSNAGAKPFSVLRPVETIFTALFLARSSSATTLEGETRRAFDQLWELQVPEGRLQGAWRWYSADLDPWETPESSFYGASLAAMAVAATPAPYRNEPAVRERIAQLIAFLRRELPNQPLHNRLALLWASSKLPAILPEADRRAIIDEALKKQGSDGGWTMESIGAWVQRDKAPPQPGSNAYATAFTTFALREGGVEKAILARAHTWLRAHQDPKTGAWPALSMNKVYPPDSMQIKFMQDAASGFAALALLQWGKLQLAAGFSPLFVFWREIFPPQQPPFDMMQFTRRHLPHLYVTEHPLFVTFCLHGSLPRERHFDQNSLTSGEAFVQMDRLLDGAASGPLYLRMPKIASLVADNIRDGAGEQYALHAWVIMPNHVHILITPHGDTSEVMRRLKGVTAREANRALNRTGAFWQHESYDRLVRDSREFSNVENYIVRNPVRAGLAARAEDYRWSSAWSEGTGLKAG